MFKRPTTPQSFIVASFLAAGLGAAFLFRLPVPAIPQGYAAVLNGREQAEWDLVQDATEDCGDLDCLRERLKSWVRMEGAEAAFRRLKLLYQRGGMAKGHCHQLAHEVGHAGFDLYRDVATAFSHGDPFCWSGYFHGVLESFVADIGYVRLPERLDGICAAIPGREAHSFDYYNCVHGIGHGVMAVMGDDIRASLELCGRLDGRWEQQSCYGGVFMQNNINEYFGGHRSDFKSDDLAYPCSVVDHRYKDSCYISQTSHMLGVLEGDYAKVFSACAAIPDREFLDTCYQSIGRDASGGSVSDAERTKATCMLGTDVQQRTGCVIGAAKDFVSYFHSDVQARAFCSILGDTELETTCLAAVEQFYVSFR